jgi:hypothetical protein
MDEWASRIEPESKGWLDAHVHMRVQESVGDMPASAHKETLCRFLGFDVFIGPPQTCKLTVRLTGRGPQSRHFTRNRSFRAKPKAGEK